MIKLLRVLLTVTLTSAVLFNASVPIFAQNLIADFKSKNYPELSFIDNLIYTDKTVFEDITNTLTKELAAQGIADYDKESFFELAKQIYEEHKEAEKARFQDYQKGVEAYNSAIAAADFFGKACWDSQKDEAKETVDYKGQTYSCINFMQGITHGILTEKYYKEQIDNGNLEPSTPNRPEQNSVFNKINTLLPRYGFAQADYRKIYNYLNKIILNSEDYCSNDIKIVDYMPGLENSINGKSTGRKEASKNNKEKHYLDCTSVSQAMVLLALISQEKENTSKSIYQSCSAAWDEDWGIITIQGCALGLMELNTNSSWENLEKLLLDETYIPKGFKSFLWLLEQLSIQNISDISITTINKIRGGGGNYLNGFNEKGQYLIQEGDNPYTTVYGNIFEDIGRIIGENKSSGAMVLKAKILKRYLFFTRPLKAVPLNPMLASSITNYMSQIKTGNQIHTPLVAGILSSNGVNGQDANKAAQLINSLDWWDINEGTQEYINNLVLSNKALSGVEKKGKLVGKSKRYKDNQVVKEAAMWSDVAVMVIFIPRIASGLPTLIKNSKLIAKSSARIMKLSMAGKFNLLKLTHVKVASMALATEEGSKRLYAIRKQAVMNVRNSGNNANKLQNARMDLATAQYKANKAIIEANQVQSSLKGAKPNLQEIKQAAQPAGTMQKAPMTSVQTQNLNAVYYKAHKAFNNFNTAQHNFKQASRWSVRFNDWFNKTSLAKFWNKPSEPYTLYPLIGKETTIAKALGIKTPYMGPRINNNFGIHNIVRQETLADKAYAWLNRHDLIKTERFARLVNNRATAMAAALLFNYNLATVTPAFASTARTLAQTETVASIGRTPVAKNIFKFTTANINPTLSKIKPVDVFDPTIFKTYKTLPMISGNIVLGTIKKSNIQPYTLPTPQLNILLKPSLIGLMVAQSISPLSAMENFPNYYRNPKHHIQKMYDQKQLYRHLNSNLNNNLHKNSYMLNNTNNSVNSYIDIRDIELLSDRTYSQAIANAANRTHGKVQKTTLQMIADIEQQGFVPREIISTEVYDTYVNKLSKIYKYLTVSAFNQLIEVIAKPNLLEKITNKQGTKKQVDSYKKFLNYFDDVYDHIIASTDNGRTVKLFTISGIPSMKDITTQKAIATLEELDEKTFAKNTITTFFTTQSLKQLLFNQINTLSTQELLALSTEIIKQKYNANELSLKYSGPIKGCLINTASTWESTDKITPNMIGISVESNIDDIGNIITKWIHKNNIPLATKPATLDEVLNNLGPWIEDQLGIITAKPFHYVENSLGDLHVYNEDYTKRLRIGQHELQNDHPHFHIESLQNQAWKGIDNISYDFSHYAGSRDAVVSGLQNLKKYFNPATTTNEDVTKWTDISDFKPANNFDLNAADLAIIEKDIVPSEKVIYLLGGPNGSGKTNIYNKLLANKNLPFLNPDILARHQNLSDMAASRQILPQIEATISSGKSFVLESTLSGRYYAQLLKSSKAQGYKIVTLYSFVETPEVAISRIASRVAQGGHNVADDIIKKRFYKSRSNFWNIYEGISDKWIMYLNNSDGIKPIARKIKNTNIQILDEAEFYRTNSTYLPNNL